MADSELGELRRAPRLPEQRIHRIAAWRGQGLAGGTSDDVYPTDFDDDSLASDGAGEGDGGALPSWTFDTFDVTSSTTVVYLSAYPLPRSEIVRLNGITLEPTVDYTIEGRTLTLVSPSTLLLGIVGSWDLVASYAYVETADDSGDIVLIADIHAEAIGDTWTPTYTLGDGDVGLLFTLGGSTTPSGYFATWTRIHYGGDYPNSGSDYSWFDVWKGTGIGTGTLDDPDPDGAGVLSGTILVVIADVGDVALELLDIEYQSFPSSPVVIGASASAGDLVVTAIRNDNDGIGYTGSVSACSATGFAATHEVSGRLDTTYANSTSISIGIADGGAFSASYSFGVAYGTQAAAFRIITP